MLPLLLACQDPPSSAYALLVADETDTVTDSVDRVSVAPTALWAPLGDRPVARPKALDQAVAKWLEEAREPALDKLWTLSGGGR